MRLVSDRVDPTLYSGLLGSIEVLGSSIISMYFEINYYNSSSIWFWLFLHLRDEYVHYQTTIRVRINQNTPTISLFLHSLIGEPHKLVFPLTSGHSPTCSGCSTGRGWPWSGGHTYSHTRIIEVASFPVPQNGNCTITGPWMGRD